MSNNNINLHELSHEDLIAHITLLEQRLEAVAPTPAPTHAEQELERTRILAAFTRDVSHEFRTPLATIRTAAYLLERALHNETSNPQRHITRVIIETERILNLVDSLLLLARLDQTTTLSRTPMNVNNTLYTLEVSLQKLLQEKSLTLEIVYTTPDPIIEADEFLLRLALQQLLDNALHFTSPGSKVILSATHTDAALYITITDEGNGISPHDMPYIFERFYRADQAHTTPGMGLGLTIARKIITLHNGTLILNNRTDDPQTGAIATIQLPGHTNKLSGSPG